MQRKLITLERGLCGCHGTGDPSTGKWTVSGMSSCLPAYYHEVVDGGWVIDKREVLTRDPYLAIRSPLMDPTLADGEVDRLGDVRGTIIAQALLSARTADNEFGKLLQIHDDITQHVDDPGPLDTVSLVAYVRWWKDKGARTAYKVSSTVETTKHFLIWADTGPEQILTVRCTRCGATVSDDPSARNHPHSTPDNKWCV